MLSLIFQSAILSMPVPSNVGALLSCQRGLLLLARGCDQVPDVRVYRRRMVIALELVLGVSLCHLFR